MSEKPEKTPPAKIPKTKSQVQARQAIRRQRVAAMTIQGLSQREIASQLTCNIRTVSGDLKEIRKRWATEYSQGIMYHYSRMVQELNYAKKEAWQAWEKSKSGEERNVQQTEEQEGVIEGGGSGVHGGGKKSKSLKETKHSAGNPAYLRILKDLIGQEAEILGIGTEAHKEIIKTQINIQQNVGVPNLEDLDMTPDEMEVLAKVMERRSVLKIEADPKLAHEVSKLPPQSLRPPEEVDILDVTPTEPPTAPPTTDE